MSTQQTTTAVADPRAERRVTIRRLFENQRPELSKLLPKNMSLDRLERIALTECVKNPKLLDCSAESWALAMQTCAAQGLYPDSGLGYMYLIPRENSKKRGNEWIKVMEVTAQRGYQGDLQLARNSGEIADIYAEVVYEKDAFKVRKGLDRTIEHEPYMGDEEPGKLTHTYAVAKLKSGEVAWVVLTRRDVERHKASAFKTDDPKSPWNKHEAEMWKKTAIHALAKWLPKSSENMELLARGDDEPAARPAIDVTASVPLQAERPALEVVKDQLREEAATSVPAETDEAPVAGCEHPKMPPSEAEKLAAAGKQAVCPDCGTVLAEPGAAREPGSDDDEATVKEFIEKTAPKAETEPKGKARQQRLSEQ